MTAFNAKPHEIRAMLSGDEFCAVRPLREQPPMGYTVARFTGEHSVEFDCDPPIAEPRYIAVDYAPGDVVTVKEAHYLTDDGDEQFAVFTDDAEIVRKHLADIDRLETRWPWIDKEIIAGHRRLRSSAQMPAWASRLTLTVESVAVKRVQDVTTEEAIRAGTLSEKFMDDEPFVTSVWAEKWDQHHPKTPWSDNPWVCIASCKVHHCNIARSHQRRLRR